MGKPIEISETGFDKEVLQSDIPVLMYFWGPSCNPCRAVAPVIEELAEDFDGRISFVKVNVEECPAISSRYGVMGLPTLLVLKAGRPVNTLIGQKSKDELKENLETVLQSVI